MGLLLVLPFVNAVTFGSTCKNAGWNDKIRLCRSMIHDDVIIFVLEELWRRHTGKSTNIMFQK